MPEKLLNQEAQETLPKAVSEVVGLYLGDQLTALLGTQGTELRDELWNRKAQEFPTFSDKITELRERMKVVGETKKAYPPQLASVTCMPFMRLEDVMAREFLGDVLFSRMTESQGYLDYGLNPGDEAKTMGDEMGLLEGWRSDQAKGVTLEKAVESVLKGTLRVTYQPKEEA